MTINSWVTELILSGEFQIKHVDYCRDGESVDVTVTHADSWELDALRRVHWEGFTSGHPDLATITFQQGHHLLTHFRLHSGSQFLEWQSFLHYCDPSRS